MEEEVFDPYFVDGLTKTFFIQLDGIEMYAVRDVDLLKEKGLIYKAIGGPSYMLSGKLSNSISTINSCGRAAFNRDRLMKLATQKEYETTPRRM